MKFPFAAGRGRGLADIACRQAVEMVTDYIEDALPGDDAFADVFRRWRAEG